MLLSELDATPVRYRIPGLLTMNGNVLFSAYRKLGKTTLTASLITALTTDSQFLGLPCKPLDGPLVYVNLELHQNMLREYMLSQGNDLDTKLVGVQDYRGDAGRFHLEDDAWRHDYADMLYNYRASALIIDPLSPLMAMNAVDSDNNDMARMVLEQLGEIAAEAELHHLIVVDHTGHADKTRARGASGKADWADVLWNLSGDEKGKDRTLDVMGRGTSGSVSYSMDGSGQLAPLQSQAETHDLSYSVLEQLRDHPDGLSVTRMVELTGKPQKTLSRTLNRLEERQEARRIAGHGKRGDTWLLVTDDV